MAYLGRQPVIGNFVKLDTISVVNGQAAYTMQNNSVNFTDYATVNQFLVSLNGVIQAPTSSFTVSGSTLTFASNLATGDVIDFIIVFGNSLSAGTPTDATVTSAKLATLTSAMNFQGAASDMRLNFDTTDTVANATPLMAITAKNKTDSVAQLSMRRESAVDDGYIALSTQPTGGAVTERVRIHSGGVMSATQGIALGVGTANTASNVLDDYEEGLHTPTLSDTSGNVTSIALNSSYNQLAYTKIGRLVHISGTIVISSFSGSWGSGALRMTLPFTSADLTDQAGKSTMSVGVYNVDFTAGTSPYMQVTENTTNADFYVSGDNNTGGKCQPQSSGQLYIGGCYIAA